MFRLGLGFVLGYVAGSKAGRERYEQIARLSSQVVDHPAVQGAAGAVQAKLSNLLPSNRKQQDTAVPSEAESDVIIVGTPPPSTLEVTTPNAYPSGPVPAGFEHGQRAGLRTEANRAR